MEVNVDSVIRLAQHKIKTRVKAPEELKRPAICEICKNLIEVGQRYHDSTSQYTRGHVECVKKYLEEHNVFEVPPREKRIIVKKEEVPSEKIKIIDGVIMYQLYVFDTTTKKIDSRFGRMKYSEFMEKEAEYFTSIGRKAYVEYRTYKKDKACALFVDDIAEDWRWVKP